MNCTSNYKGACLITCYVTLNLIGKYSKGTCVRGVLSHLIGSPGALVVMTDRVLVFFVIGVLFVSGVVVVYVDCFEFIISHPLCQACISLIEHAEADF